MKRFCTGILAHVDAGKTTLSEAILYKSNAIQTAGRVDHQNSAMDFDEQEKSRGITIYSKEAAFDWKNSHITLIDTPGHADFSAEMERALSILDCAVLLISGLDGVQPHTRTIWECLKHAGIPVLLFLNKMDISHRTREELVEEIHRELDGNVVDMADPEKEETLALASEQLLADYMETGQLPPALLQEAFASRQFFPLYAGSALKMEGVEDLLDGLDTFVLDRIWPEEFGARIYRVEPDENGQLVSHLKITGGTLKSRQKLDEEHKADQIRIYQGARFFQTAEVQAGMVCALRGLSEFPAGTGFGFEKDLPAPSLLPCLQYEIQADSSHDATQILEKLQPLIRQDPTLDIRIPEGSRKVYIQLMGEIQKEILQKKMRDLCGFEIGFGAASVICRETIAAPVEGFGHFEPLRHYAEVHLRLEPLPPGSGLEFASQVSTDQLALNWQRLILSHLQEKHHKGVLTGSDITDLKITLTAGRAHAKHTVGGDFRQATYRAVRQGLRKSQSVLLEPFYSYVLEVPSSCLSRAMFDLEQRKAEIQVFQKPDGTMQLRGKGPVRTLMHMRNEVLAYSRGQGTVSLKLDGYYPSPEQDRLVRESGYDPDADLANPCSSVFCASGSGYTVEWDEVEEHLHIPRIQESSGSYQTMQRSVSDAQARAAFEKAGGQNRKEKKEPVRKRPKKTSVIEKKEVHIEPRKPVCLIVDGYNMLYSWKRFARASSGNLAGARDELASLLINYCGYRGWSLILVFDGYRVKDNPGSNFQNGTATIVYTRYGQSADSYIEKKVRELAGEYRLLVASSDGLIQNSILSKASRMSARELEQRVEHVNAQAMQDLKNLR